MAQRSLTDRILDVLDLAMRPLTAAEIRRWLPDDVSPEELASRLYKMRGRGQIVATQQEKRAITGPRTIKAYSIPESSPSGAEPREYIPGLP